MGIRDEGEVQKRKHTFEKSPFQGKSASRFPQIVVKRTGSGHMVGLVERLHLIDEPVEMQAQ